MSFRNISDNSFIESVRNNAYRNWNRKELLAELQDPRRIDAVRQLVIETDKDLCLQLITSKDSLDIFLFHSLARSIIRNNPEEFVKPLSEAIDYWNDQEEDIASTIVICLYHDLFEHSPSLFGHRNDFAWFIRNNPEASRKFLSGFLPTEKDYIDILNKRLLDVFNNKGSETLNNPEKAFTYILYLGLLQESEAKRQAIDVVKSYMSKGDKFFQQTCKETLKALGV